MIKCIEDRIDRDMVEVRAETPSGATVRLECFPSGEVTVEECFDIIEGLRDFEGIIQTAGGATC